MMNDKDFEALTEKCDRNYEIIKANKEAVCSLETAITFLDEELRLGREIAERRELKIRILAENLKSEIGFVNFLCIFVIVAGFSCFVAGYYFGIKQEKYTHPYRNLPAQTAPDLEPLILEEINRENMKP